MRLIYNTDSARLQKGFNDTTPVTISEMLRAERTAEVPLELFLVDNDGGYDTPGSSDYEVVLGRAGQKLNTGILTLTWTGTTEAIDLSKPKLRERIEAALNSMAEIATAGGVDVETLDSGRAYSITFRSAGSRAALTASVAESIQPAGVYLSEATAGNGSTKEVQILTLEEAALAEVTTSGWSANSAPALAISTIVEGTASTREVVEVSVSNDPAPGSFFVLLDSQPISTEATSAQVKATLNTLLSDDIGSVKKTGQRKWQITYASNGDKTALSAGSGNLVKRPAVTATLALTTTGLAYAAKEDGTPLSVGFTLRKGEEVYYQEDITLLEPAAELTSGSTPLSSAGATFEQALLKTGGTMTGAIAMGSQKITGLADGTASGDAINKGQLDGLIDDAPEALETLNALAAALGDDENHAATMTTLVAQKLPLAGGTMTGDITITDASKKLRVGNTDYKNGAIEGNGNDIRISPGGTKSLILHGGDELGIQILDGGNVGIGTATPTESLHVSDAANVQLKLQSSGAVCGIHMTNSAGDNHYFSANTSVLTIQADAHGSEGILKLMTGASERMRIDSSGNVGIGTAVPAAPLAVKVGTSGTEDKVFEVVSNDDRTLSILQPNNGDTNDAWTFFTNNAYTFRVDAIDALNITSAGNVGIGTASPTYKFEVSNGTQTGTFNPNAGGYMFLGSTSNHSLILGSNDLLRMTILSNGLVGINTTAPSSLLDVRGDAGAPGILTLSTAETTVVADDVLGKINFSAPLEADGSAAIAIAASIHAVATDTFVSSTNATDIVFSVAQSEAATEKMRLTSAGELTLSGGMTAGGSMTYSGVQAVTASANLATTAYYCPVSTGGGAFTLTIPTAQHIVGRKIIVKDIDGYANSYNITIATESSQTIDGNATAVISTAKGYRELICTSSTTWHIIASDA